MEKIVDRPISTAMGIVAFLLHFLIWYKTQKTNRASVDTPIRGVHNPHSDDPIQNCYL